MSLSISVKYWVMRNRIRARYHMLFPASKMTERRRWVLADYLGYRDIYQDRDGHWMGKQGVTYGSGPSGFWWALPDDADLVKQARAEWRRRK